MPNFKKLLCITLAALMILTCLPVIAMAEEMTTTAAPVELDETVTTTATEETPVDESVPTEDTPAEETPAEGEEAPAEGEETPAEGEETEQEPVVPAPEEFEVITDEEALAAGKLVATNGNMELYLLEDKEEQYLNIAVKNKATGEIWFTNPVNAKDDPYVQGSLKLQQQAQLMVTYVDTRNQTSNTNSKVSCVNQDAAYTIEEISTDTEKGICITYDFARKKEQFSIPVNYTITEDSFKAEIVTDKIDEGEGRTESPNRIMSITLLPHFGAGSINDEGYLFIPDGSGAVINFNNGEGHRSEYMRPIYGRDEGVTLTIKYSVTQPQILPVFGIVNNNAGYVAVIGGSDAEIMASPSSPKRSSFNQVGTTFILRKKDSYIMGEGNWDAKTLTTISPYMYSSTNLSVEYFLLDQNDVSYAGMARRYREYLVETQGFENQAITGDMPMFLEIYGAVTRAGNVLGFPTETIEAMTTYDELATILSAAKEKGINRAVVDYVGWQKGGPNKTVPLKLKFEGKLGGEKAYNNLLEVAASMNSEIFPRVEFLSLSKASSGYSANKLFAKSVNRTPFQVYPFQLGSGTKDLDSTATYLLSNSKIREIGERFLTGYNQLGLKNLSVQSLVGKQYTDYQTKALYDRGFQQQAVVDVLGNLSEDLSILMKTPNAYAIPYADYISAVPTFSSDYLVEDYAVPFVQIVLHGWVPYSSPELSTSGDLEEAFLKSIETGSNLLFTFTGKETSVLKDSEYNFLYASDYTVWLDIAAEKYNEINAVLGDLQDVEIQNHRFVQKDVFETVYADGTSILVNYSKADVTVDGRTVKAESYDVKKGGNA